MNSVLGTVIDGVTSFDYDAARTRLYVGRAPSNAVSVPEPGLEAIPLAALALFTAARRRRSTA